MSRFLKIIVITLLGLTIAQALAIQMVYKADLASLKTLETIKNAGYLAIPNPHVFPSLKSVDSAFSGGIFFTLTSGLFLTMISILAAQIWDNLFSGKKTFLILITIFLLLFLLMANLKGWSPFISLYLLVIPPCIFLVAHLWLPPKAEGNTILKIITGMASLAVIAVFLFFFRPANFNIERFVDFRDHFLLSTPVGKKINAFYYDNSLYSTQAFKSLGQQLLKTCKVENINTPSLYNQVTKRLLSRDYLPVEGNIEPDLIVKKKGDTYELIHDNQVIISPSIREFSKSPYAILKKFEKKTDRHGFFRAFTMLSMLFILALVVYLPVTFLCDLIFSRFLNPVSSIIVSGLIFTFAGIFVIFAMHASDTKELNDSEILAKALTSRDLTRRITALKHIQKNSIEISQYPAYRKSAGSAHIPERYWLAKALGKSKTQDTHMILRKLLDDPHFNVVCMALNALGHRNIKSDIWPILNKIETSDNWYVQLYGYKALRRLGWVQKKLK